MLKRINPEISLGFVVASLFWIAVLGWQSSYSLPENEKQRCYEEAKKTGHKDEECKSFWERTTSDPIAFFTFTLSIVTLALGAISLRQFHYLRRSDETARIAANAADTSARAAIAVELPRLHIVIESENLRNLLSAAIQNPAVTKEESEGLIGIAAKINYHFKNYGKTPAILREISWGRLVFGQEPPIPVYIYSPKSLPERMIAAEGKTVSEVTSLDTLLTFAQTKAILEGETALWFYGRVIYGDVFGNEQWHRFYWRFKGIGPLEPYNHEHYNEDARIEHPRSP